ncbi:MAG: hypothetical protein ACM3JC_00970 [Rudaea sp.]
MSPTGTACEDAIERDVAERSQIGSALLGRAAVLIWNDVAPEGRAQFYTWHDHEHIPERLSLPGFLRGRRYIKRGHSPEWLTMYEAVDVSALVSPQYFDRLNAPTPATRRTLAFFRNTSRAVCRLVYSVGSSSGGHVLATRISVDGARADAMCAYLREHGFPSAMDEAEVLACHLYAADASASYANTTESSTRAFDVPAWVLLCEASTSDAAERARDLIVANEFARLGVHMRADAAVYALEICRLAPGVLARICA